MELNPIVLSIPIYFILIGIEVAYDRIKSKKLYRLNDAIGNISCGITEQVTGVFVKVFTVAIYHYAFVNFALFEIPQTLPWAIVLFIAVDFFYYWAHRLSHEINLFWLGHSIHHQSEDYNFSVALRQGALQKVFTAPVFIPLAVLGFETEWFLYVGAFSTLYQFWIHTEAINKLPKWFEYLFNTPSHHRVHHGRNPKYIDKNHGGTFIIFDRIFGTFQAEEEKPTYGVTTPINTFDPIKAHIKPISALITDFKEVKGIANKFLLLVKPPGWFPKVNGGFRKPPEITSITSQKFNTQITSSLATYVLVQYVAVLAIAAYFLFNAANLAGIEGLVVAGLVLVHVMVIGKLLDTSSTAKAAEFIRLIISAGALFGLNSSNSFSLVVAIFISVSVVWYLFITKKSAQSVIL